jgi:hypothetical protein
MERACSMNVGKRNACRLLVGEIRPLRKPRSRWAAISKMGR